MKKDDSIYSDRIEGSLPETTGFLCEILNSQGVFSFTIKTHISEDGSIGFDNWGDFVLYFSDLYKVDDLGLMSSNFERLVIDFCTKAVNNVEVKETRISLSKDREIILFCCPKGDNELLLLIKNTIEDNDCKEKIGLINEIEDISTLGYFVYNFETREVSVSTWIYNLLTKKNCYRCQFTSAELSEYFRDGEQERVRSILLKAVEDKSDVFLTAKVYDILGDSYHIRLSGRIKYSVDGKVKELYGSVIDISEQVMFRTEAIRENKRFRELYNHTRILFDSIDDFIWSKDVEGRFVFVNNAMATRILGAKSPEDVIGRTEDYFQERRFDERNTEIFRPDKSFDYRSHDLHVLENKISDRYDIRGEFGGQTCYIDVHKTPVVDKQGVLLGLVGSARDVTLFRNVEKELIRSQRQLTESQELAKIGHWEHNFLINETTWSNEFFRLFGLKEEKIKPQLSTMISWVVPEEREFVESYYNGTYSKEDSFNITYRIKIKRKILFVRDIGKIIRNAENTLIKVYGSIQDISELKINEIEAIRHKRRLEGLVNTLPDLLMIIDSKFRLVDFYSDDTVDAFFDAQKYVGKSLVKALPKYVVRDMKKRIQVTLTSGEPQLYDLPFGEGLFQRYFEVRIALFESDKVVFIIRDRTENIKIEKELVNAKRKAEESDHLKSAFLANMSHEIRTPLNAIVGFSSLLSDEGLSAFDKAKFLEIITRNSDQLLTLISDIIDVSKIESGQLEINKSRIIVDSVLKRLKKNYEEQRIRRGKSEIEIRLIFPDPSVLIPLTTDPSRFEQIMSNLINNALKFTSKGYIEIGYHFEREADGFLSIYVKDSGIGISSENLTVIFQQFRQEDFSITRKFGGTGLGLSISKKLAKLMGGDIYVQSEKGKGSTFTLELPYVSLSDDY